MSLRDSLNWNREWEMGLPDCRVKGASPIVRAHMLWDRVYCANCGGDGGLITAEWSPHVFYICDDCVSRAPLDLTPVDEAKVRGLAT